MMHVVNITAIRQNASKIIAQTVSSKEPVMIVQRSKPVAYLVEAGVYEAMQQQVASTHQQTAREKAKTALAHLHRLREQMQQTGGIQPDSAAIIRELREGYRSE